MPHVRWLLVLLVLVGLSEGEAATRLGLFATSEERSIWQSRMTNTTQGINGFTYQAIYQNRILPEANEFVSMATPKDGFWVGYTGAGCHPGQQSPAPGGGPLGRYGRGNGAVMARAALVYFLTGTTSYATAIRDALLVQAGTAGTDFTNTSKWCPDTMGGGAMLEIGPWLWRLLLSYDYLKAGGYTGWTSGQETTIRTWLYTGIKYFTDRWVSSMAGTSYPGVFNEPSDLSFWASGEKGFQSDDLWFGGPILWENTYFPWYNQPMNIFGLSMGAGIVFEDAVMVSNAKKYFTGFLTAGHWSNGANPDFVRWHDCTPGCPGSMWAHAMSPAGWMVAVADMLARTGDTSLYDLSVTSTALDGGGGTVTLLKSAQRWAQMANKTITLYGTMDSGDLVPNRVLTWDSDVGACCGNYHDFSFMLANIYYNDSQVHTAMTRTTLGTNSPLQDSGCNDGQYGGCFSGSYNFWPDLPFLFGNMEGAVQPWNLTAGAPVVVLSASPDTIASGGSSTLAWSTTDATACTASGGWSGSKGVSGFESVSPTITTTYTLTCTGPVAPEGADSAMVTVAAACLPQAGLAVQSVDSQHTGYAATLAIDGNGNTFWHTVFTDPPPGHPHTLVLSIPPATVIDRVRYTPRQDAPEFGGTIVDYVLDTSLDNVSYTPAATGTWAPTPASKEATFSPRAATYVRLTSVAAQAGEPYASAAEVEVCAPPVIPPSAAPVIWRVTR